MGDKGRRETSLNMSYFIDLIWNHMYFIQLENKIKFKKETPQSGE